MKLFSLAVDEVIRQLTSILHVKQRQKRRTAIQGIVLTVAAADVLPRNLTRLILLAALALLVESFGRDVRWLWRRRHAVPDAAPEGEGRPREHGRLRTGVGVGVTVLVEKICGAAAAEGRPLDAVAAIVPSDVVWEGFSYSSPAGTGKPSFSLRGKALPFVPYSAPGRGKDVKEAGRRASPERAAAATIPVERFAGALLVAGGEQDEGDASGEHERLKVASPGRLAIRDRGVRESAEVASFIALPGDFCTLSRGGRDVHSRLSWRFLLCAMTALAASRMCGVER